MGIQGSGTKNPHCSFFQSLGCGGTLDESLLSPESQCLPCKMESSLFLKVIEKNNGAPGEGASSARCPNNLKLVLPPGPTMHPFTGYRPPSWPTRYPCPLYPHLGSEAREQSLSPLHVWGTWRQKFLKSPPRGCLTAKAYPPSIPPAPPPPQSRWRLARPPPSKQISTLSSSSHSTLL